MESKRKITQKILASLTAYEVPAIGFVNENKLYTDGNLDAEKVALLDEAYTSEDTYTGNGGISWMHRWALTQGKQGEFFKGEPEAPAFVHDVAALK